MEDYTVSICMITYNHEKWIAKAIEGILMQKTNFKYLLVIGEDCSTDNTLSICRAYAKKHPEKIELLKTKENLGMNNNIFRTLNACNGKYIALCEGDDYWTDPGKLQRQVNFLESNPQYGGVAENAKVVNYTSNENHPFGIKESRIIKERELIRSRQFATASLLFNNNLTFPNEYKNLPVVDTLLFLTIIKSKLIYYNNIISSVYNITNTGATSTHLYKLKEFIHFYNIIDKNTNFKHSRLIKSLIKDLKIKADVKSNNYLLKRIKNHINQKIINLFIKVFKIDSKNYFDIRNLNFIKVIFYRI